MFAPSKQPFDQIFCHLFQWCIYESTLPGNQLIIIVLKRTALIVAGQDVASIYGRVSVVNESTQQTK